MAHTTNKKSFWFKQLDQVTNFFKRIYIKIANFFTFIANVFRAKPASYTGNQALPAVVCSGICPIELANHNRAENCWILINGHVYNVSSFDSHPGGNEILLQYAGKDATDEFNRTGHTDGALSMLRNFEISAEELDSLKCKHDGPCIVPKP